MPQNDYLSWLTGRPTSSPQPRKASRFSLGDALRQTMSGPVGIGIPSGSPPGIASPTVMRKSGLDAIDPSTANAVRQLLKGVPLFGTPVDSQDSDAVSAEARGEQMPAVDRSVSSIRLDPFPMSDPTLDIVRNIGTLPGMTPIVPPAGISSAQRRANSIGLQSLAAQKARDSRQEAIALQQLPDFAGLFHNSSVEDILKRLAPPAVNQTQTEQTTDANPARNLRSAVGSNGSGAPPIDPVSRFAFTREAFQDAIDHGWDVVTPKSGEGPGIPTYLAMRQMRWADRYFDGKKWVEPNITMSATPSDVEVRDQNTAYEQGFTARQPNPNRNKGLGEMFGKGIYDLARTLQDTLAVASDPIGFQQDKDWQRGVALHFKDGYHDEEDFPYTNVAAQFLGGVLNSPNQMLSAAGYTMKHPSEVVRDLPKYGGKIVDSVNFLDPSIDGPQRFGRMINALFTGAAIGHAGPKIIEGIRDPFFNARLGEHAGFSSPDVIRLKDDQGSFPTSDGTPFTTPRGSGPTRNTKANAKFDFDAPGQGGFPPEVTSGGRGKAAILKALDDEWEVGSAFTNKTQYEFARRYFANLPDRLFSGLVRSGEGPQTSSSLHERGLGTSFKNPERSSDIAGLSTRQAGEYDFEDSWMKISRLLTDAFSSSRTASQALAHEFGHHLQNFLTNADLSAIRDQWEAEKSLATAGQLEQAKYQRLDEWWAEKIEDQYNRDSKTGDIFQSHIPSSPFDSVLRKSAGMLRTFLRNFKSPTSNGSVHDSAMDIYRDILGSSKRVHGGLDNPGMSLTIEENAKADRRQLRP